MHVKMGEFYTRLSDHVRIFDPEVETWVSFSNKLKWFLFENEIGDDQKSAVLLSRLNESSYKLMKVLASPDKPEILDFEEICVLFDNHFSGKEKVKECQFYFDKTERWPRETFVNYAERLRNLARNCNFGESLDEKLLEKFIIGINDDDVRKQLCVENGDMTFEKALSLVQTIKENKPKPISRPIRPKPVQNEYNGDQVSTIITHIFDYLYEKMIRFYFIMSFIKL